MSESDMKRLSVGDRVIDTEDDDPSVGVVVARPPEQTIAEWEFSTDDGTKTTADTNPEYPAETQLVVIAFKNALNGYWSDWYEADPDELYQGVRENDVHHYGFPEPRLALVSESESETREDTEPTEQQAEPPEQFEPIIERLEQNDFSVAYDADAQELHVEKFGVEHTIDPDGTVQGESGIKGRVETIVNRFL
ncbi:hypothetical protein [Haladaptatus salinisoli]|uniref:hypothetical protein n=1 Tax=Haladaptatus salinisoli TaxID=2884876 RepID=UPI001D0A425A|nr:hypothetical protein [Haladaptatus salinisoli]